MLVLILKYVTLKQLEDFQLYSLFFPVLLVNSGTFLQTAQ